VAGPLVSVSDRWPHPAPHPPVPPAPRRDRFWSCAPRPRMRGCRPRH